MSPAAVVTGAARGMGAATVDALVSAGWQVVALDRCADDPALDYPLATKSDLEEVAARHGAAVRTVVGDVRSRADLREAVDEAIRHFGGLQAAVAVAGVIGGGPPLWEADDAQWDVLFDINVNGVRNLAAAAVPTLLHAPEPRAGRFVAVASAAGLLGLPRLSGYSASKHAVIGLVRSLAADLAGTGITANAVCPGSTRGPMLTASAAVYGLGSPEEFAVHQLVERLLEPAEPAALIALALRPGRRRGHGGRTARRRRHDDVVGTRERGGRPCPSAPTWTRSAMWSPRPRRAAAPAWPSGGPGSTYGCA